MERFRLGQSGFAAWLSGWSRLRDSGWEVAVLIAPDHAIGLAYLPTKGEVKT